MCTNEFESGGKQVVHILMFLCNSPIHLNVSLLNVNRLLQDKNQHAFFLNI